MEREPKEAELRCALLSSCLPIFFSLFIPILAENGYAIMFLFIKYLLKAEHVQNIISDAEER